MLRQMNLLVLLSALILFSCTDEEAEPARKLKKVNLQSESKKEGFNPLKHGFACDTMKIRVETNGKIIKGLVPSLGETAIDTIKVNSLKLEKGTEKDVLIMDYNFDGFCDFILPNIASASHGGMNHYFYIYIPENQGYKYIKSLPKFNGGVKLDIKNQRLKIYCPYNDCFAYYEYQQDGTFKLVKGEFRVEP